MRRVWRSVLRHVSRRVEKLVRKFLPTCYATSDMKVSPLKISALLRLRIIQSETGGVDHAYEYLGD